MRQSYELQWAGKDLGQEAQVALGDINGDGIINVVAGTTAISGSSYIHCFRYDEGRYDEMARYSLGDEYTCSLQVEDIDQDGKAEIIVGTNENIRIYKFEGEGLAQKGLYPLKREVLSLAVADVDGDGRTEIILALKGSPRLYIFRWEMKLELVWEEAYPENITCIAQGDTDGDGLSEVVVKTVAAARCKIYVTSFKSGKRYDKYHGHIPGGKHKFLLVADFDGTGKMQIITDVSGQRLRAYGLQGQAYGVLWEGPDLGFDPLDASCFDLDGDGKVELVVVGINTVHIYTWRGDRLLLEWNQTVPNGVFCVKAGRLMKKGYGEIVLGTVYGYIYVLEPRRDQYRGKLFVGRVQAIIQDTVTIPYEKPDVERGIEAQVRFSIDKVKVIYDKVIVEGEVLGKILYVAALPSQPVHFFQASFPFLEFIHLCGADPGMEALVFFRTEHIKVTAIDSRHIKITVLFEMVVKLVPGFHHYPDKCHHHGQDCHDKYYQDKHYKDKYYKDKPYPDSPHYDYY